MTESRVATFQCWREVRSSHSIDDVETVGFGREIMANPSPSSEMSTPHFIAREWLEVNAVGGKGSDERTIVFVG